MTGNEEIIEIQGAAEKEPFPRNQLDRLMELAVHGCRQVAAAQNEIQ
jgi:ribonuclease PH